MRGVVVICGWLVDGWWMVGGWGGGWGGGWCVHIAIASHRRA